MANQVNGKPKKKRKDMTKWERIWADYGNLIILGICFVAVVLIGTIAIVIGAVSSSSKTKVTSSSASAVPSGDNYTVLTGLEQLNPPADGEEIAVLDTTMGTIKIRLFPQQAPLAVENFKGLINQGYYNGIIFHRVINGFMIQGGDPTGTGTGGESIWGQAFKDEYQRGLYNFRGALSMANAGSNTNGSQFFIVQTKNVKEDSLSALEQAGVSSEIIAKYREIGGTPHLDGGFGMHCHTVFGQVFEGMDVVDAIAAVEVDGSSKPLTDVVINTATIEEYHNHD